MNGISEVNKTDKTKCKVYSVKQVKPKDRNSNKRQLNTCMGPQGRIQTKSKTKNKVETSKNSKRSRKLSHPQLTTDVKGLTQSKKDPVAENREQESRNSCKLPDNGTERRPKTKPLKSKLYEKFYNKQIKTGKKAGTNLNQYIGSKQKYKWTAQAGPIRKIRQEYSIQNQNTRTMPKISLKIIPRNTPKTPQTALKPGKTNPRKTNLDKMDSSNIQIEASSPIPIKMDSSTARIESREQCMVRKVRIRAAPPKYKQRTLSKVRISVS